MTAIQWVLVLRRISAPRRATTVARGTGSSSRFARIIANSADVCESCRWRHDTSYGSAIVCGGLGIGLVLFLLIRWDGFLPAREASQGIPAAPPDAAPPEESSTDGRRQTPAGPFEPADPRWELRRQRRQADPVYDWKTPIAFYGKVVGDNGNAVEGATVDAIWNDLSAEGTSSLQIASDASGLFSIIGIRGKRINVNVSKPGYDLEKTKSRISFEYAGFWEPTYHEPDPTNPVLFYLRRRQEAEPMIHFGPSLLAAPNDGRPAFLRVANGKKSSRRERGLVSAHHRWAKDEETLRLECESGCARGRGSHRII